MQQALPPRRRRLTKLAWSAYAVLLVGSAVTGTRFGVADAVVSARTRSVHEAGSGSWLAVTVTEARRPRAVLAVAGPGFHVEPTEPLPTTGRGEDADARRARRSAVALTTLMVENFAGRGSQPALPADRAVPGLAGIGGPSAGLLMSLAGLDRSVPVDLTGGLTVAATGTVDRLGTVGVVGAVEFKSRAVAGSGADVMFVPVGNADDVTASHVPVSFTLAVPDGRYHDEWYAAAGDAFHQRRLHGGPRTLHVVPVTHVADALWFLCGATGDHQTCDTATATVHELAFRQRHRVLRAYMERLRAERRHQYQVRAAHAAAELRSGGLYGSY